MHNGPDVQAGRLAALTTKATSELDVLGLCDVVSDIQVKQEAK